LKLAGVSFGVSSSQCTGKSYTLCCSFSEILGSQNFAQTLGETLGNISPPPRANSLPTLKNISYEISYTMFSSIFISEHNFEITIFAAILKIVATYLKNSIF